MFDEISSSLSTTTNNVTVNHHKQCLRETDGETDRRAPPGQPTEGAGLLLSRGLCGGLDPEGGFEILESKGTNDSKQDLENSQDLHTNTSLSFLFSFSLSQGN